MSAPVVFISAASVDLRGWRTHLHTAFSRAGFRVLTQDKSLRSAPGNVRRLLTETINEADCVIHLAGLGYGSHATDAFPNSPEFQCSWTQFEYYYAHELKKDVLAFVCSPELSEKKFTEEADSPEDLATKQNTQKAHRERVLSGLFTGTPLERVVGRTSNESVETSGELLEAVAAAVGTLQHCEARFSVAAKKELEIINVLISQLAWRQRYAHSLVAFAIILIAVVGFVTWQVKGNTDKIDPIAVQISEVQRTLDKIRQSADQKFDPIGQWPQERLEAELAARMDVSLERLREILTSGRTSLDNLIAGQALLASGRRSEAEKKFDLVILHDHPAIKRLQQGWEGKAQIAYDTAKYNQALVYFQNAANLIDKLGDPIGWASAHLSIARVLSDLAKYKEAEHIEQEVVQIFGESLGRDNLQYAIALGNLAMFQRATHRFREAEATMRKAVSILELALDKNNYLLSLALDNHAVLLDDLREYIQSEALHRRALKICEDKLGAEHSNTGRMLNNLAITLMQTERISEAEPLLRRALQISKAHSDANQLTVARSLSSLAMLLGRTGRLEAAEANFRDAFKIEENILGPDHPEVADTLRACY